MRDILEDRLEALHGPAMPAEVEARLRQRLQVEAGRRRSRPRRGAKRLRPSASWLLLVVLLLTAVWVFRQSVIPVLRAAWERSHCAVDSTSKKETIPSSSGRVPAK